MTSRRSGWIRTAAASTAVLLLAAVCASMPARAAGVLPGATSKDPYTVDAAKLDYLEKEQKLIYTGDVIATQGPTKVKGTVMTIYLDKGTSGSDRQVRRIEVTGPVTVVQNGKIGIGDAGLYDKAENKWYLLGNVTLTEGSDVTQGDKLIYDLATSTALVDSGKQGRVKSVFVPKDSEKPAEAPPAGKAAESKPGDRAKPAAARKPAPVARAQ